MSKHYDIKNIASGPWYGSIHLHLATSDRGYETVLLPAGGSLESIAEERITDHVRQLMKQKRERPPVVGLVEVDHEARLAERAKERELYILRAKKLKAIEVPASTEVLPEDSHIGRKKKFKKHSDDLSDEERIALESGKELP